MNITDLEFLLDDATAARTEFLENKHVTAFRLFNGFFEGYPELVLDIFGNTLLIYNYSDKPEIVLQSVREVYPLILKRLPWIRCVIVKQRQLPSRVSQSGIVVYGTTPTTKIKEHGVWYACDLTLNQDASFYCDTRNLRYWLLHNITGKSLLNTFAYTGSLGVAARMGEASRVVQSEKNIKYIELARQSYMNNSLSIRKSDFLIGDFFTSIAYIKRQRILFDCVIIDPPFFSKTRKGIVDMIAHSDRIINKVRPLITHQGFLICINNALFVSGEEFMKQLQRCCYDGYLQLETIIPVPPDITGFPATRKTESFFDYAPFNHSTKIAILRVTRKENHQI